MKKIIKIISWILGILVGFIVVIAASVIIDQGMGVNRLDGITNTVIPNGNEPAIRAYVARPSGTGPFPVVIMVVHSTMSGLTEGYSSIADEHHRPEHSLQCRI